MNLLDQIVLLATGLVAIYLLWRLWAHYGRSGRPRHDLYYMVSFAVLLVAGLLLIAFTYSVLSSPLVVIVAVLIPAGLSLGLVTEFARKYEMPYLGFVVVGMFAVAITRLAGPSALATPVLIIVHTVAGLLIVALPLWAVNARKAPGGFSLVAVGGVLIGLGGIALAFLKTGSQLLFFSSSFVFMILAPLLLLMTLAFTWGMVKKMLSAR